jgi:hypothetical protein
MGRQRVVRERRRGLADALRKFPAVAQQLQLPKASGQVRAKAAALVAGRWLRRNWRLALGVAIVLAGAVVGRFGDGGPAR